MTKCCFCEHEHPDDEIRNICATCLEWLEAEAVPGPADSVTGHDRGSALHLVDTLQDGGSITDKAFDLLRKCISRGAQHRRCNCRACRPCGTGGTE